MQASEEGRVPSPVRMLQTAMKPPPKTSPLAATEWRNPSLGIFLAVPASVPLDYVFRLRPECSLTIGADWYRPDDDFSSWRVVEHPCHVKRMQLFYLPTRSTPSRPDRRDGTSPDARWGEVPLLIGLDPKGWHASEDRELRMPCPWLGLFTLRVRDEIKGELHA